MLPRTIVAAALARAARERRERKEVAAAMMLAFLHILQSGRILRRHLHSRSWLGPRLNGVYN
jgi:hypothetical protein